MVKAASPLINKRVKKREMTKHHKWTEDEIDIVRRDYRGTNKSAGEIAERLNVTLFAVKGQAAKLGIMMQKSPRWSPEEIDRLSNMIHTYSIDQIAKKLHRSKNAVKVKATRLKLKLRLRDTWYTKREACEVMGVDHKKVQAWIDCGALEATWHNGRRPSSKGSAMWHITVDALRKFLINHSGELMGRNVDIQQIVWILTGMVGDVPSNEVKEVEE
jgi:hypothetical protein